MSDIIIKGEKIMAFEDLRYLAVSAGKTEAFVDRLWEELLAKPALYDEFLYYLKAGTIKGQLSVEGYDLLDLFVYMMSYSNLRNDTGKNTALCDKTEMVLDSFMAMAELMNDPEGYIKKLNEGRGMDKM
ncbi:MAG: hypothetical protein K6A74_10260 [Lachnospiraceae bacterium]|nr:hypothetical protein [Lachnospiraceae bacterium]